jgi:ribonuclease R
MVGERGGRVFQLAGRVRVMVARVDLETAKIDFALADALAAVPSAPGTRAVQDGAHARTDRPGRKTPKR